jgi:hypothetical protein
VALSAHAVEQYRVRVKLELDSDRARADLERLRALGEITTLPPAWANAARRADQYLLLSDAVVLPLAPHADGWIATTCVAQRALTPARHAGKPARAVSLAARRRAVRRDWP